MIDKSFLCLFFFRYPLSISPFLPFFQIFFLEISSTNAIRRIGGKANRRNKVTFFLSLDCVSFAIITTIRGI